MIFFRFVRACSKYHFTFVLSTYGSLTLILRPINTFENITIKDECYNSYTKIFKQSIKAMKQYRLTH